MSNESKKRPWTLLPLPAPCDFDPGPEFFYNNFVEPICRDMIELMCTGLYIDEHATEELRSTIDEVLSNVESSLMRNKIIQKLQEKRSVVAQKVHFAKSTEAIRTIDYYLKDFDEKSCVHRTWVINTYLISKGFEKDVKDSWTISNLKKYNVFKSDLVIDRILEKCISKDSQVLKDGMKALAEYKMELWNRPRYQRGRETAYLEPFNPGSSKQKQELFAMLKIEPFEVSDKTGDGSWGREHIEHLLKTSDGSDTGYEEVLQCIIDHSFSGIVRGTFLKAFDTYTIDGVLHGNIKMLGAKSARPTSNSPNLLNFPSTKSVYAKPLKKCFIAPEGMLVIQCDFQSLEDVVLANISGDAGKIAILTDTTLDSHCYNAMGYFADEIEAIIGSHGTFVEKVRRFKIGVDEGNTELKELRQRSKPHTFGLAYGKFPDEHKGGAITQSIFDNYHNVLYPGVTTFREGYVLETAKEQGYLHLGLGFRIYSDDPEKDIRTLNNACSQMWSFLTLIAVNELNYRIKQKGWQDKIQLCSTIYDSIYAYIVPDPEVIQWYNNNVYEVGRKDFMEDQEIPNNLTCGLGKNWSQEISIPIGASIKEVQEVIDKVLSDT